MGDICKMHNIERVLRSKEGVAYLEEIRQALLGRTVVEVEFSNEIDGIGVTLLLDNGESFFIGQPFLEVEFLQEQFEEAIQREWLKEVDP